MRVLLAAATAGALVPAGCGGGGDGGHYMAQSAIEQHLTDEIVNALGSVQRDTGLPVAGQTHVTCTPAGGHDYTCLLPDPVPGGSTSTERATANPDGTFTEHADTIK
jgi:hypothetical protein